MIKEHTPWESSLGWVVSEVVVQGSNPRFVTLCVSSRWIILSALSDIPSIVRQQCCLLDFVNLEATPILTLLGAEWVCVCVILSVSKKMGVHYVTSLAWRPVRSEAWIPNSLSSRYQRSWENTQSISRWDIVSSVWLHSSHVAGCGGQRHTRSD